MLSAECERQEALAARGEAEFNCELYGTMCDRLARLFGRLGLERRSRDVSPPTLAQYLEAKAERRPGRLDHSRSPAIASGSGADKGYLRHSEAGRVERGAARQSSGARRHERF
jgi:hypothetical protein